MKDLYGHYKQILGSSDQARTATSRLLNLYKEIPDTKGCMENISKKNGCGGWCCKYQNPQILYSEYLMIWRHVHKEFTKDEIFELYRRSMVNYSLGDVTKGCVIFDHENLTCPVHKVRPLNCRTYGITPKEEFDKKFEKFKQKYKGKLGNVVKDQCDLVSTCGGEEVTVEDSDNWWQKIVGIESQMGINERKITDADGGTYRTIHDHILLHNMPKDIMDALNTIIKISERDIKEEVIERCMDTIKLRLEGIDIGKPEV